MSTIIEVFEGGDGWRVRLLDGENGEILATTEAFDSKSNATRAATNWAGRLQTPRMRFAS